MGSKWGLAKWVVENLPPAPLLVDAFAGGCAVSHAAALAGWPEIIANDLVPFGVKLFRECACAEDVPDEWKRWVSREEFMRLRNTDSFVRLVWCFGGKADYWCAREKESYYRALWRARVNGDRSGWDAFAPCDPDPVSIRREAEAVRRAAKVNMPRPWRLKLQERLVCLANIIADGRHGLLGGVRYSFADYSELPTDDPATVVYCDPPYIGTTGYCSADGRRMTFDHSRFYAWAESIAALPVISERAMPADRFACVAERAGRNLLCATRNTACVERLYVPRNRIDEYYSRLQR